MKPSLEELYGVCEQTWPPARAWQAHGATLRDGQGGGKRVSAATCEGVPEHLKPIEAAMISMGQTPLFMIQAGEDALDKHLEANGYDIVDPVHVYSAPIGALTEKPVPPVTCFSIWEPLAIMAEIWAAGGIGPERIEVMRRASVKTGILARWQDKPAGVAFAGISGATCMVHAVEVLAHQRRNGVAQWIMRQAAFWAQEHGASWISVLCTKANVPANALYKGMGFERMGAYHYRMKGEI